MTSETSLMIYLLYRRFAHHSLHSGYHQLGKYVGTPIQVPSRFLRFSGVPLLARVYSTMRGYDCGTFYNDLAVGFSMLWGQKAIYHHLYGDFVGRWQFPGARRHKILATFHLPSETVTDTVEKAKHIRSIDAAVVVGRNQIDLFSNLLGPARVFFVPHGVDITTFSPGEHKDLEDNPMVLCVGRTFRDFSTLYKVAVAVGERSPKTRFLLIAHPTGIESDLARLTTLENFDFRAGISEAELIQAYQRSRVLFLPLLASTANNSLLEGMACGLPIVVTDVGGVRDYVNDESVALVPLGDSEVAAEMVLDLLQNERKRTAWGQANRRHALRFDWPIIAEEMNRVYRRVWER